LAHRARRVVRARRLRRICEVALAIFLALLPAGVTVARTAAAGPPAVTIFSSADPVEATLPFELWASVQFSSEPFLYRWTDSQGGSSNDATWVLDVGQPGNLTVSLVVSSPSGGVAESTMTVLVEPPLGLALDDPGGRAETGVPTQFSVQISGGVPPISVNWSPEGGGLGGTVSGLGDGNYSEQTTFSAPGLGRVLATAVDALGHSVVDEDYVADVEPRGSISFLTNGSIAEVGSPLGIAVDLFGGWPPYLWSLGSSVALTDGNLSFGVFNSTGPYRWNVSFAYAGTAVLNLTTLDALGVQASELVKLLVEPPVTVETTALTNESKRPFEVSASVSGGVPPFLYTFRLSDGELAQGVTASDGSISAAFDPGQDGNFTVEVSVTDALGRSSESTEIVLVDGPVTAPPGVTVSGASLYGGIAVLVVLVGIAALYAHRRFRKSADAPSSGPTSALLAIRRLMEQSQIIDRDTLLLLCEEEGESSDAARAALQVLLRTGEVTSEPGPADDVVLRWKGIDPLAPSAAGSS
jgi:hypothetical protein